MIIPIQQKKEGVLDKAFAIRDNLKSNYSVKVDESDKFSGMEIQRAGDSGYSYSYYELVLRILRKIRR